MKCETWSSFKTMCNQSEIQFWILHDRPAGDQIVKEEEQYIEEEFEEIVEEDETQFIEEEEQIVEEEEQLDFETAMTTEEVIIEEDEDVGLTTTNFQSNCKSKPSQPKKRIRKVSVQKSPKAINFLFFPLSVAAWIHGDYLQSITCGQTRDAAQVCVRDEYVPTIHEY